MYRTIRLNHHNYVVAAETYVRRWARLFNALVSAAGLFLNFVDKGPGMRVYNMTVILHTWPDDSLPHLDGVTETMDEQITNLEHAYGLLTASLEFYDPYGHPPSANMGVFFTNLEESIPAYSTVQSPYTLMKLELTESTQTVNIPA